MKTASCGSCGARIIWTITEKGARMPVDAEPAIGGKFALSDTTAHTPTAVYVGDRVDPNGQPEPGRVSHFVTCPNAAKHRKPR